jgi:ketosteroid isomerase-like protein
MIGAIIAKRKVPAWFEAMNRHDLQALLSNYTDDTAMEYPGDVPGVSGTFTGIDALRAWYQRYFEQFPEIHYTLKHVAVTNLLDLVGNNVIAVQWVAQVVNREGLNLQTDGVSIVTARRGKAIQLTVYMAASSEQLRTAWGVGSQQAA